MGNRMFAEMLKSARERLVGRDPAEIARLASVEFDAGQSRFEFKSLGRRITVSWPELVVEGAQEGWHQLVILHYLAIADGIPQTGRWISFAGLKDGMIRGGGFDRRSASALSAMLGGLSENEAAAVCAALGAVPVDSNADLCAVIPFLPEYPVCLKLWLADEEIPASARMMVDASADHYLTVEDAVTVGEIVLSELQAGISALKKG